MKQKKISVGFDFDGVILYNPARIIRPIVAQVKALKPKKKSPNLSFYYTDSRLKQMILHMLHWSSFCVAPGFDRVKALVNDDLIEAHIVTARYGFLQKDFDRWLAKIGADSVFTSWHLNLNNEQPHLFKERKLHELGVNYFFEDNWDIISHLKQSSLLSGQLHQPYWISNVLDYSIPYQHKFLTFSAAIKDFEKTIRSSS